MKRDMHANSLRNLAPTWKPGESGNPAGRPAAGLSVIEAMNLMAEWPEAQIREVADDDAAPASKRAAAKRWLAAINGDRERDAREALCFVCKYTHGNPRQTAMIHHVDPEAMRDIEAGRAIARDPQLRDIAKQLARRLETLGHAGQQLVVDAEAVIVEGGEDD